MAGEQGSRVASRGPPAGKGSWQNIITYHTFTQIFHNTRWKEIRSRQRQSWAETCLSVLCQFRDVCNFSLLLQIDADDVITREEQIYVLFGAHAQCEKTIKAQMERVEGECAAIQSLLS